MLELWGMRSNPLFRLFSGITRTVVGGGVFPLSRDAVSVFYSHSRLGNQPTGLPVCLFVC